MLCGTDTLSSSVAAFPTVPTSLVTSVAEPSAGESSFSSQRSSCTGGSAERRRLVTTPEAVVAILRDDGSEVRGTGLEVDVRSKTVRFTGPVSGTLVIDSPEEE